MRTKNCNYYYYIYYTIFNSATVQMNIRHIPLHLHKVIVLASLHLNVHITVERYRLVAES